MVLSMVGLGLGDERDITIRGMDAVRGADRVYLEAYTSLLDLGPVESAISRLEDFYGREIILADREMVEQAAEEIVEAARSEKVAFLVVGDPFGATTHSDLVVRARRSGVEVEVIHNASVMNAIGVCGLQLYRFGETISIPFFTETWKPDSFYDKIKANRTLGLHTLCLLDIRVKEPSVEALCRGLKNTYEPPRYMSINTAVEQLLEVEEQRKEKAYSDETLAVGLARLGTKSQKIVAGTLKQLEATEFGAPLHCLVITGNVHVMENEMLSFFAT
ncbi:hypothetical protein SELMODRAFT_232025 [Selaginella moellendorffii]|uniref:diphthine methyl ester synthase n=1 Tax=Selaginella moellendorffii TaxID=88036 RepID=D8RQI7_SELML|nr:probable diphthine methyl ester synthase [Selaginella moellendorffii]EFJ25454.1 hypothetical protein SELMODRAFT_232025 [Selaginella moellendorffii]|eukprot:XP_002973080.1 probable diphthine methyl ester synthase [Selaginella moellendorffii]